jgi:hypothetical protein
LRIVKNYTYVVKEDLSKMRIISSKVMTNNEELVINLLLAERLTCIDEIEDKLKNVLTINSIFLGGIIGAFIYAFDKNLNIIFIAIALLIFSWVWMIYSDLHYFWMNSKLICKIEDEINTIIGLTIMKRENFFVEYHKKHFYYNIISQFFTMLPVLLIYLYSVHRSALYLSEKYPSLKSWFYLIGLSGIFFILMSIYHIYYSIPDNDSKFLEEFIKKRSQTLPNILDKSEDNDR